MIYLILLLSSISAAVGQIFLKKGAYSFFNGYLFFGVFLYFLGFLLWVYCLSKINLTIVYSFTLLTFVMVFLLSYCFLNEKVSLMSGLGILIVSLGFAMIVKGQT